MLIVLSIIIVIILFLFIYLIFGNRFNFFNNGDVIISSVAALTIGTLFYIIIINIAVIMLMITLVSLTAMGLAYWHIRFHNKRSNQSSDDIK